MTTIEQQRQQVATAQQQIQEVSTEIAQKRQEAQQEKQNLQKQQSKLPRKTQSRLRAGIFQGLQGLTRRQQVSKVKEAIKTGTERIKELEKGISDYEMNVLDPYKAEVQRSQSAIAQYDKHNNAKNLALDVFFGSAPFTALEYNSLAKKYYSYIQAGQQAQIEQAIAQMEQQAGMTFSPDIRYELEQQLKNKGFAELPDLNLNQRGLSQTDITKDISPIQQVAVTSQSTISRAPSSLERWKKSTEGYRYIGGTLDWLGGELGRATKKLSSTSFGGEKISYQPTGFQKFGELLPQSLYFVPYVGAPLLFGVGTESYLTPGGRAEIKNQAQQFEQVGIPGQVAWAIPAGEIVAGGLGIRSSIKGSIQARQTPNTEFLGTVYRDVKPGASRIDIFGRTTQGEGTLYFAGTDIGKVSRIGAGAQFEEPRTYLSSLGRIKQDVPGFGYFGTTGRTEKLGKAYITREAGGVKVRGEIGEGVLTRTKTYPRGEGEISDYSLMIFGRGEGGYRVAGGKPKLRIKRDTGELSYFVREPTQKGFLSVVQTKPTVDSGIKVYRPSKPSKSPLFRDEIPRPKPVVKKPQVKLTAKEQKVVSQFVSSAEGEALSRMRSQFWGTGLYERTTGGALPLVTQQDLGFQTLPSNIQQSQFQVFSVQKNPSVELDSGVSLFSDVKTQTGIESGLKIRNLLRTDSELKTRTENVNLLDTKGVLETRNVMKTPLVLKVKNLLRKKTETETMTQSQSQNKKEKSKRKRKIPLPTPFGKLEEDKELKSDEELFEIFRKTKGKPEFFAKARTEFEAFKKLKKGLKETLSASGWIEKAGQRLKIGDWGGGEFRPSKKSKDILVQKRGFRLGTRGEVFQIQRARGKKKRIKKMDWMR